MDSILGLGVIDSCSQSILMYSYGLMIAYTRIQMLLTSLRQYDDVRTRIMGLSEESLRTHAAFLYIALGTGECNAADDVVQSLRPMQYIAM
jgi:hypothetical protein